MSYSIAHFQQPWIIQGFEKSTFNQAMHEGARWDLFNGQIQNFSSYEVKCLSKIPIHPGRMQSLTSGLQFYTYMSCGNPQQIHIWKSGIRFDCNVYFHIRIEIKWCWEENRVETKESSAEFSNGSYMSRILAWTPNLHFLWSF